MLMIAGVNLTMAQGLSSNDIKASWDFKNGTVAYSIVSADIPAGSSFAWTVDSKSVTDGISNSGQTITLPLTNKTRSGDVTITSADNTSQTIAFSIEPKAYGVNYDGNHFYADSYQLYPDGTEGDGSKEKPYLISNDLELARLAHEVNNGAAQQMFSQKYFKLTKDIDLSKGLWTPIGTSLGILNATDGHFFAGKFDGDGHSVSNLLIKWSFNTAKEASWGLFARLNGKGNNENEYAAVTNLIIDNARIEKAANHFPLNNANYTVKMGIVVADMTQNAELSNIIIRNSKITDNNESFSTKTKFRIGGIAGYLNNFVSLRIFNISADTEIDMFRNAALNGVEGQVTISCGFGAASKLANQTGYVVWPRNIYVHGSGLKTSANTTQCKKASVMAFIAADNFANKVKDTWYYTPANKAADTYAYNQYGVEKDISATDATTGEPFGKTFAELNNLYINQNNLDKRPWLYSNSSKRFSFSSIALKAERGTSDVLTVTTEDGETTSDVYNWYASTDNTEGEKVNSTACNPFTLPRQTYSQYVYAMTVDGSQRTNTVLVEAIGITAELDYDTKPDTYIINVKNDTKENFTNDELGLDITYEWHNKETLLSETSNEFVRPETATNKDQYNCTVTVKSGGNIIFHKNIKVTIVVYLCPEAVSINGTTYAQGEDNDDEEWGYSPTQAMKTWKGAYSKLSKTGTWDENIIVLMGTSHTDVTNNQYTGFNITSNNRGKSILKFDEWAKAKGESTLFRNATITGDWDGTDYKGTIEIYGAEKGLPIWGDTRFEYITFNNDPVTNNGGDFYKIIYCQYNNLEMDEGIQMTGFGQNSPDYGTIDGAVTTAFHIFGGFNNDGRFFPLSNKKNISDFEQSMPHGKEGFKISIKSGFYSAICAGGRQTSSEKDYNGVMGTPNLPIKCTIEMDIDRKWNDAHNPERKIKGETSKRKSDYDAGIILAGSHEGAMYADVDIIIRSGKVARVVNGSLGAQRDFILPYNGTDYYVPNNTYMGRANILLNPASSKHNNDEWIDNRVIVTEMYGGSTGRGHTGNVIVNNPFYGYSTITINGGLFEILPAGNTKKDNIFCGIYGAGAGGMNGIGEGDDNAYSHTPDKSIAYWNESGDVMLYGPYAVAKDRLVTYHCYNNDDFESFTDVDPTNTNTKIVINGGEFGSTTDPIDGIYGGGSGFMSKGLWSSTAATPNKCGGNVYGKVGATVASITINGGEFHCTNGIFAGGRGTDFFYSQNPYGGNSGNYKALGKTYGNVELNINGGIFYCPVFGGGYGVADAKEMGTSNVETLSDMARLYGQSSVNIMGGTFYKNIYGGGDMAIVEFDGNATNVVIGDSADIRGSVFAGGNGRRLRPASQAFAAGDGFTQHPELVGLVAGNANVSFAGSTQQAPFIYGDIFGGGNLAQVANDTHVNIYAGNIAGEVFGGGNGDITDGSVTSADVLGNTNVTLAQDEGGTQNVGHGPIDDSFSINVIWFKMWDPVENIFYIWDPDIDDAGDEPATEDTVYEKSKFYADGKFLNPHNIYGGGNLACNVGTYKDADGNVTTTPADGTGLATVMMQKGMTPYELLITDEWKQSYTDNENPHFSVFGGGYGRLTTVGSTDVTVNVDGDYGKNGPGHDGNIDPNDPSFDNSMGAPNFTVWAVLGGRYAGTVAGNTKVTVDGKTFIRRVFGGGFGDIASTEDNTTGQIGGNTEVYMRGAFTHGDVFGGSAGLKPETASSTHFITVARVIGTTMVEVADDANIYGNVYGGGDNANVGIFQEVKPSDYYSPDLLTSASTLNQTDGSFISYSAGGYRSFVNIRGGNIFGNVYGGGVGCKKAEANQYYNIGRINGNTLVHVVNSNPGVDSGIDNVVPCVWGDIYGSCEYGTIDGNTLVHIEGGMLGKNVYGGGYGDIDIDSELTVDKEVLGKKDIADTGTYADILGNTKVQIDGGSWIWNRKADSNGNITTWLDAESDSSPICKDNNEFRKIAYAIDRATSLDDIGDPLAQNAIDRIRNNENTKKFFDLDRFTFTNNYNIFGGGNRACHVGSASVANTGKSVVIINHSPLDDIKDSKGKTISMFENTTLQGLCWFMNSIYVSSPSFSVFGAGYGVNTSVGKTEVYAQPGAKFDDDGLITINGIKYRYLYQNKDFKTYLDLEDDIYNDYLKLSKEDKKLYFGSYDGGESDPNIFRRYHISRLAWKIGEPGLVLLQIHGGGYSGKVVGDTHIVGSGGVFCRRVFGGGTYSSVNSTDVELKAIDCHDIFGGGFMGDVLKSTTVRIGDNKPATSPHTYSNADIFIHGNVYGGNDVSGYVNVGLNKNGYFMDNGGTGTTINIYGGHLFGDVYGAGNGNYLYATDRNGNKNVTVNEYYPINPNDPDSETVPLVYTVPMRENMTQSRATSDAVKMVNINSWRPLTNKVSINIQGVSTSDTVRIDGNVYGGGNSATVQKLLAYGASEDTDKSAGDISVNIGNHVRIGGVFMGCNGEELFVKSEDNDFMNMFQKLNGDINDYTQELDFAEPIDWINDSENANISTVYLPTEKSKRPIVYPYLLDLYFQPVETNIQGSLKWNGSETGEGLTDCVIGTFCCGGNRGNMNVMPKTSGKIGNVLEYTFPEGLTITDKIVGGCNNTNYDYKGNAKHRGGYLLGDADSEYPFIKLNIRNKFMPKEKNGAYVGGNVYGGCFKSGTIVGDVLINLQSDMLAGKDKDKLEKSNELLVKSAEYSALNVYGAGYAMESYIYGIANVTIGESVKCSEPKMDGNKFLPCGVVDPDSNPEGLGVSANFVYGGGQQGNVVGYSTIKMLNGHIFRAVTGGSYSGYVYGSTQVIVGYPTYYSTNRQNHVRGRYELKRADRKNLGVENDNGKEKTPAIKQHIYLLNDEWISQGVYEDIVAIDNGNGMRDTITDANRAHYFKKIVSAAPSVGWENVNITIDEAVYGGGYSVAQGSVLANNTTVLKLTDKYNLDYAIIANGNGDDLNLLPGGSTAGFCGNTLVVVGDNKDSEHITISHQDIRPVQLPDGTDLYGYYYKHYASDDDAANGIYTYRYISLQDKYFFKSGATPPSGLEGIRENEFYEYDSEGGIFGDGHLSYAQGFRSADLTGYGFAEHTIDNPKILNTLQRLDIIRLEDNCFSLLGARDYTVNNVDKTPYSIARVGEIKMVANDIRFDSNGNLEAKPDNNTDFRYSTKARNYMGFSNNILYVSAITSNVDFNSGMWRNRNGQLAAASTDNTAFAGMSYQGVKQHYIDDYNANKVKEDTEDPFGEFQKRNDGTAMNMIGIASGYAMKIQLCHETYDSDRKKVVENKLYGPIYGVVEMNLINVREDEGGGYVYADNNHKRHDGDSHEEDFLETTGNFVFPYHKGRYIVDDCFPTGYHAITAPGSDKTVDDVKVHYWYVTGFHYYYNVNISGYTFKSSKENPLEFDSDNKDGLTVLAGLKSTQPISIFNWKMRSGHPDDKSQYSSDLEYRNYLTGTETNETDKTYYSDAVAGGYKLYVGGAESNNFSGATSIDDPDKASKGFAALLSMREKGDDEATLFNNSLPAGLKEDAKISFRLVDMVDNTNYVEPDYFDKHLGRKSMATLVLKAPAYEEYVSETDNKPIYTNTGKFYKKTETGYELVESGSLDADNTYYQPQTEEFVKINNLFTYNTVNKKYEKVENISDVIIDESNPTVYYVQREYTYTIYLTIEYVQGPTVSGQITIGNCALPGEMVRVTKDNIVVSADQSFAVNGYYWRIGKRQMGADGKWEFKDTTPWTKENISNNVATGYDTFNQADENGKGLFAGCHYDKTDDLLDVPVYYYMNGYGIQLGVSITGLNDILEVGMHDADKFVVHNYHRMDPHKAGINLHLAEAITRVNEESLDTTESDPLPEPRIYISDKSDLSAFVAFVDSIGTDSNAPRYGAKAQFFLQNDIALEATDKGGYYISDFAGILHGDGHVISGIPSGKSLFNNIESSGNIYNLGLASGKISNLTADGKIGNYHCCFEYAPASGKSGSTPVVYRWDGSPYKGYTTEDFRLGRVAYDLNEYYLRARHRDAATTSSTEADADNEILKYVSAYYANGDYQYACRTDAITGKNTGITYLRIGKGGDTPNYEQVETRHDKTHPLDAPRVKYNADGSIPTPVVYTPLFNANNSGTEPMNDFLFWGQSLQHNPDNYPCDIASHQNSYMSNRVYRTAAYYGDTSLDAFHYNAYNNGSITMSTYVHDSATTAVDFTCLHDLPAATETVGGIFYPPMDDNASRFNDFVVKEDAGITQNLLVYTADNDEATGNEAYDVVEKALNYNETTREALINGHHITKGIDGYSTTLLHLVERTPDNDNGDGETCNNNNLCVPIAFNVNDRAWYVRRPLHYAEDSKGAWEGICLPFTVDKAAASLNDEITHFYGSPSDAETDNPSQNIHSLHHEYWLRGLTSIATEGNVPSAVFQRPGAALFSPTDASGNALTNGVSYTFANTFFVDNYADKLYNQYANPYYATAHNYPDYLRLAGEVPYIVRFPGARYYEFDLSSAFYNDIFGAWEDAQTVTFNAYGDNHTGDTSYGAITIPITKGMATMVGGKYSHLGTFSAINVSNGNVYGMNDSGTAFDDASSLSTVTPFRTYMSPTATRSNARYDYTSVINIAEQNADNIMPDMEENEDDAQTEDHITVRAIGNQRVRIESTMATRLNVVTVAGQLYRILDVQPGIATYSDFQPGLYIFGTTKVIVR